MSLRGDMIERLSSCYVLCIVRAYFGMQPCKSLQKSRNLVQVHEMAYPVTGGAMPLPALLGQAVVSR